MSLDQQDFASVVTKQQTGAQGTFFPIILPGSQSVVGVEVEVNISPIDGLWLPSCYDYTMGLHPAQLQGGANPILGPKPIGPPFSPVSQIPYGVNVTDRLETKTGNNGYQAPIWALRFNSTNNPWLLWSLGTLQNIENFGNDGSGDPLGQMFVGYGGAMRSITGPISRLWCRLCRYAIVDTEIATENNMFNQTTLIGSLGFSQQTIENNQPVADTSAAILKAPSPGNISILSSGGYITPQLNSANKRYLGVQE